MYGSEKVKSSTPQKTVLVCVFVCFNNKSGESVSDAKLKTKIPIPRMNV